MKRHIIQKDEDNAGILRKISRELSKEEIQNQSIQNLIQDMSETLANQKDGVALSAPQVGENVRIFIVSHKLFDNDTDQVFINPIITNRAKEIQEMEEGCLSIRGWYGMVQRNTKVTIEALDAKGEKTNRGASDLLAQIFQHEIDHLDGILFTDKATDLRLITSE